MNRAQFPFKGKDSPLRPWEPAWVKEAALWWHRMKRDTQEIAGIFCVDEAEVYNRLSRIRAIARERT